MEIPIIGKLFKKSSGQVPEVPPPVQLERFRPKVQKEEIRESLMRRKGDRESIEKARVVLSAPTKEFFDEFVNREGGAVDTIRKFVRSGDRIVIGDYITPHAYCALAAEMSEVDDAGYIEQKSKGEKFIFISAGSEGLHILDGNENRPATIELLRKLVPDFVFEEKPRPIKKGF